jgi:2-oxoglutarate dehydrogenase E1 component
VTRLGVEFRQRFGKDVVIDRYCYRKYGHNEADEPRFTQPLMYKLIDEKPTVREVYVKRLAAAGRVTNEQADRIKDERKALLERALEEARSGDHLAMPNAMQGVWEGFKGGPDASAPEVSTTVSRDVLIDTLDKLAKIPDGFHANQKVQKLIEQRHQRAVANQPLDWGTGEHLAFATLLLDGKDVRLSGQDARRGTFSHRHSVLFDTENGERYTPLENIGAAGKFQVWDSPLSEAGVLGFEYGYSLDTPDGLTIWEAQFGDFLNSGQVIVDQFIVSAEDKWLRLSGLVMLLPHGYEGQGPEHSSARIERFLTLAAEDNIQVCNLTTPAQFFHALRRQLLRPLRKPLVVFSPKSLLRHPLAVSPLEDFTHGRFQRVIPSKADPAKVKKILLCTGKVYYDLAEGRKTRQRDDVAIVRLEQLYPFNGEIVEALAPYKAGTPLVWVQEEPRNMGSWYFINSRLRDVIGDRLPLSYVARAESASPATGSHASHQLEQKMLIEAAFAS